jgi:hypothetical protein
MRGFRAIPTGYQWLDPISIRIYLCLTPLFFFARTWGTLLILLNYFSGSFFNALDMADVVTPSWRVISAMESHKPPTT